jgi:hypothetical protein
MTSKAAEAGGGPASLGTTGDWSDKHESSSETRPSAPAKSATYWRHQGSDGSMLPTWRAILIPGGWWWYVTMR